MTIWTVTLRIIKGSNPWEVEDHAPALFSTREKAIDYVKRTIGNRAELVDDGMGFYEEWRNPIFLTDRAMIVEERTVDMQ
jgi:hypothetical protein